MAAWSPDDTVVQLRTFAAENRIDLGAASRKSDIVAILDRWQTEQDAPTEEELAGEPIDLGENAPVEEPTATRVAMPEEQSFVPTEEDLELPGGDVEELEETTGPLLPAANGVRVSPDRMVNAYLAGEARSSIKALQEALRVNGLYNGEIHGLADARTVQAVSAAQRRIDLDETGKPEPELLKALGFAF